MSREYLTVRRYAEKYDMPKRSVYHLIKCGRLEARTDIWPMRIPDDQEPPRKDPEVHRWQYTR